MSASNVIVCADAAHLITDAAAVHDDGTVAWVGSKVLPLPHLKAAVSSRGRVYAVSDLRQEIEHAAPATFAELIACLPEALMAARAIQTIAWPLVQEAEWSSIVNVIGWNPKRGRAQGYLLASDNEWVPAPYVPWTMHSVGRCYGPGVPGADAIVDGCRGDLRRAAVELLEAQRRDPHVNPGGGSYRRVGGFGELTTVTSAGVSTERVCEWADRIGEPIAA